MSRRFLWDEEHAAFVNLPTPEEYETVFRTLPSHRPCYSCGLQAAEEETRQIRRLRRGLALHNVTYHTHDFVYIQPSPESGSNLLEIGQIVGVAGEDLRVQVRYLGRYDDYVRIRKGLIASQGNNPKELVYDEARYFFQRSYCAVSNQKLLTQRRLYLTSRTGEVDPEQLNGRCFVKYFKYPANQEEIDKWIRHDDHFYLNQKGDPRRGLFQVDKEDLEYCEECLESREADITRAENVLGQNAPLRGLELFSGKTSPQCLYIDF